MNIPEIKDISENVKDKGIYQAPQFLNKNQIEIIQNVVNKELEKNDNVTFPVTKIQFLKKLIKFDFSTFSNSLTLLNISNKLQLKKIAETIFGQEAELYKMDTYISKKSNEMILPWHNDIGLRLEDEEAKKNFYQTAKATIDLQKNNMSARGVKFFIYMTDVTSGNGALAVIPYSHHIVKALTKLIMDKKIDLNLFWTLKDLRYFVLKNSVKPLVENIVGQNVMSEFIKNSQFLENDKDTYNFDLEMSKGGAVIFDELSVHRGSQPSKQSRVVLRYLYSKK